MISIQEARDLVRANTEQLESEFLPISDSLGRVLVSDVISPMNLPSFRQSAMDGFAMNRIDLDAGQRTFSLQQEIQAGASENIMLEKGRAIRIFTGAALPENADVVIIQEKTSLFDDEVIVEQYNNEQKSNIREVGEQIRKGQIALASGHLINPATIGFLASMGLSEVEVIQRPGISILLTGNELKSAGETLRLGEIYESNSIMLKAAIEKSGFSCSSLSKVSDDENSTTEAISKLLEKSDVLIISGGISVGKYDFVKAALEKNKVEEVFYKVDQKPGKPMYFGRKGKKLVFALPGNPASLLVCFYVYVLDALKRMSGKQDFLSSMKAPLMHNHVHRGSRPEFLRSYLSSEGVQILTAQASSILKSFAEANCLVYLHGENQTIQKGTQVTVYPIL